MDTREEGGLSTNTICLGGGGSRKRAVESYIFGSQPVFKKGTLKKFRLKKIKKNLNLHFFKFFFLRLRNLFFLLKRQKMLKSGTTTYG